MNTAARLQQSSEPWAILVGERTVQAVGDRFTFGPPREVEAKGKAQPMPARSCLGPAEPGSRPRPSARRSRRGPTQLDLTARRAFGERRPYLVSIVAPAGIGKSRLLEEFLDGLDATDPRSPSPSASLRPAPDLLADAGVLALSLVGLADDASPEVVRDAAAIRGSAQARRP